MFFKMPWSAIKRIIYKNSEQSRGKDLEKLKKSMKLVIVPNGACEQHNDVFLFSYEQSISHRYRAGSRSSH
jgi:hypothetical protein